MAELNDVVEQLKQIREGIAAQRMELQQLQREQGKFNSFTGPHTPAAHQQAFEREQRMGAIDDEMWQHTKKQYHLERQKDTLEEQLGGARKEHAAQREQGGALWNLIKSVPGGSGFTGTVQSVSGLLNNIGKGFPQIGTFMQGAGILPQMAGMATGAGGFAALGGGAAAGAGAAASGGGVMATLGGLTGALGASAGLGPVGLAVAGTIAVGKELAELPGKIRDWTRSLAESQRYLAQFSGSMALVFAESEARDYWRNNRIGEATAGSTRFLSRQSGNLSDTLAPFESAGTNIKNVLGGMAAQQATALVRAFAEISPLLTTAVMHLANMDKPEEGGALFSQWMEVAAGFKKNSIFDDPKQRPETNLERRTRISGAFAINPAWGIWNLFH